MSKTDKDIIFRIYENSFNSFRKIIGNLTEKGKGCQQVLHRRKKSQWVLSIYAKWLISLIIKEIQMKTT